MTAKTAAPADLLKRFTEDGMDGYRACEQLVALGPDAIEQAIKRAERAKRDSRETSLSRAQINLSGALVKAVDDSTARDLAVKHFGDDRHHHIAMFTDKKGATAFMLDLLAALPERCPACTRAVGDERGSGCPSDIACPVRAAEEASGAERNGDVTVEGPAEPVKKAPAGYTDEQLDAGRDARLEGLSWVKVAERAGVKSDGHFSRVLRSRYPELAESAPAEPTQGKPQAKPAKAQSKPARRRRGAKAPTGEEG